MIFKKTLKDIITIFIISTTLTTACFESAFALSDRTKETRYSVTTRDDGVKIFESSIGGLNILPYLSETSGGDLSVELSNPYCLSYTAIYAIVMYAGNWAVRLTATGILLNMAVIIYGIAASKFNKYEICGADWLNWGSNEDVDATALSNIKRYYPSKGAFGGSRKFRVQECVSDISKCTSDLVDKSFISKSGRTRLNINDKAYRERIYDGEEVANTNCRDPREEAKGYDVNQDLVARGETPYQLYYMRGFEKGNYACDRFLVGKQEEGDEFDQAYDCCVEASRSVCIRQKTGLLSDVKFCSIDEKICDFNGVEIEIFAGEDGTNDKYCARTYSLCPYNFNFQHGTEKKLSFDSSATTDGSDGVTVENECYDASNDETLSCQGRIKNFYQYNRHCTMVEEYVEVPEDINESYPPYVDKSCINFVGSSHNHIDGDYKSYNGYDKMFKTYNSFTAPIAECLTETLKNFLFNKAGHTICQKEGERPNSEETCPGGVYVTKGDDLFKVQSISSPTMTLLSRIHTLIMLTLVLMITIYGFNLLTNVDKFHRRDMVIMLLKVVIVVAFSADDWWYKQIFQFTYGFSNTLSTITGKFGFDDTKSAKKESSDTGDSLLGSDEEYIKYDGCYFGDPQNLLTDENTTIYLSNNYSAYPVDRRYVAFFDTLDCKINKYLGVGMGLDAPNIMMMLGISLIWPFNIGIYLAVATLLLAFFAINFAIKAVYIFVVSSVAMALMLYLAPIMIPCILFRRTHKIFQNWLKNLISFALQPMVLFLFVGMAITVMDKYTLGDGLFVGSGMNKELVCGYACISDAGTVIDYTNSRGSSVLTEFTETCTSGEENQILDLKRNSVLCFLNNMTSSPWALLQAFGIFIPILKDIFLSDVLSFLRVAFLFFILTQVLNTIPGIAANLTGGKELPGTKAGDPFELYKKAVDITKALSRGFKGAVSKYGGGFTKWGYDKINKLKDYVSENNEAKERAEKRGNGPQGNGGDVGVEKTEQKTN